MFGATGFAAQGIFSVPNPVYLSVVSVCRFYTKKAMTLFRRSGKFHACDGSVAAWDLKDRFNVGGHVEASRVPVHVHFGYESGSS